MCLELNDYSGGPVIVVATVGMASRRSASVQSFGLNRAVMIPQSCLLIETKKFPIMPGEDQEIVNERMNGKSFCPYLGSVLPAAGLKVPAFCVEGLGWWLELERGVFKLGLCIYSEPEAKKDPERYVLFPSIQ